MFILAKPALQPFKLYQMTEIHLHIHSWVLTFSCGEADAHVEIVAEPLNREVLHSNKVWHRNKRNSTTRTLGNLQSFNAKNKNITVYSLYIVSQLVLILVLKLYYRISFPVIFALLTARSGVFSHS